MGVSAINSTIAGLSRAGSPWLSRAAATWAPGQIESAGRGFDRTPGTRSTAKPDSAQSTGFPHVPDSSRPPTESGPRTDTAYQRNTDGDEAYLSSRTDDLTPEERQEVDKLRKRDAEVRAHEQAHIAAAAGVPVNGPHFEYTTGPDGKRYVTGGHVNIDTSPVPGDPEATIAKAQKIRQAAHAPSEPSGADRAVAAQASRMEAEARRELQKKSDDDDTSRDESTRPSDAATSDSNANRARGIDVYA